MDFQQGCIGVNKQGLEYEVLDGRISKKTKIKFSLDGQEVVTTKVYLRKGLPMHPTYGKILIGDTFTNKQGLNYEVISKGKGNYWLIRFEDGVECYKEGQSIRSGAAKHPTNGVPCVGDKFKTNSGLTVEIIEYNNAKSVKVRFEDGSENTVTSAALKSGTVGHPTSCIYVGYKFKTNSGWEGEVVRYNSCKDVLVKWQDGSFESCEASNIKSGSIKALFQPSVVNVGYFGEGRFSSYSKTSGEKAPKEIYKYWCRMLCRCYNSEEIIKNNGRRYVFVEVSKDWFCFQNFAEWALTQPNWNMGFELDKDLLGTGYEYSSNKCTFLPPNINIFLAENWTKTTHHLPIGVQFIKPATLRSKVGYTARCHTDKGREYLGYFDDPMDAYYAYKTVKEAYAKVLAERFRKVITAEAYVRLKDFELTKIYSEAPPQCSSLM